MSTPAVSTFPLPELDPRHTAVLTVDMQRAYLDPSLGNEKLAATSERIVAATSRLLGSCRSLGVPVVHVYVNRTPVELVAGLGNSPLGILRRQRTNGGEVPPDRLLGSPEAELHPALVAEGDVHVRSKKTSDGYFGTELSILFERVFRPEVVVICGINTETCVHATTFATKVRGYRTIVASDCVGTHRDPSNHDLALELMSRTIAWVVPSDQIAAALTTPAA
jgi:biuret amidohydrolase